MATIPVSIDAQGNITCPDITATVGEQVSWSVSWAGAQGSITVAPAAGKSSPFSSLTAPAKGGNSQWTAIVRSAGEYSLGDSAGKVRTPKIAIVSPVPVK